MDHLRDDFLPEGSTEPFPKTVTGAVGASLTWNRARFIVTRATLFFT